MGNVLKLVVFNAFVILVLILLTVNAAYKASAESGVLHLSVAASFVVGWMIGVDKLFVERKLLKVVNRVVVGAAILLTTTGLLNEVFSYVPPVALSDALVRMVFIALFSGVLAHGLASLIVALRIRK